jgi:beta-lactamase superfamily II metal-dependent hydrolase
MIDYGTPPAPDEIEISLFGPGFGEALAIHLGEGVWLLADSCIDPSGLQATASYLDSIGIPKSAVRVLVASHWHDDHVRGLSRLLRHYPDAELQVASVFSDTEAQAFLATYSGIAAPILTRGTKELFDAMGARKRVPFLAQRSIVIDVNLPSLGARALVTALSPTHGAYAATLARMARYIPTDGVDSPIEHAPDLTPNEEAVAIHVDWGNDALLLGSDLEGGTSYGWQAVTADPWALSRTRATAYKVAHHGSASGDHPSIWTGLLAQKPIAVLTPFNLGRHRLPKPADRTRLQQLASSVHITSGASNKPAMPHEQIKRLEQMCTGVAPVNAGFGAIRLRKHMGKSDWRAEHFGSAAAI